MTCEPRDTDEIEKPHRVLICGSRTFRSGPMVEMVMNNLRGDCIIIHGAAKGADSLAGFHAHRLGFTVEEYPANWADYGRRAGFVRNQQMLDEGKPDVVYAFVDKPLAESAGTSMMVSLAHKAGLPVVVLRYIEPDISGRSGGES